MKLYHCRDARSLRPLWTLEELGLDYDLVNMPFPPRFKQQGYLEINPLGTVPTFVDNELVMTESTAICQYLVDKYGPSELAVNVDHAHYGDYLNWLQRSDATLTFPQTLVLRYQRYEPEERRQPQIVDDYKKWFYSRLRAVEAALEHGDYLCADRFTIADICVGYALHLAQAIGLDEKFGPGTSAYLKRLSERPGFKAAMAQQQELSPIF